MVTVYKTFTKDDIQNRSVIPVDSATQQSIQTTLNNFVVYFKAKHLN